MTGKQVTHSNRPNEVACIKDLTTVSGDTFQVKEQRVIQLCTPRTRSNNRHARNEVENSSTKTCCLFQRVY